MELVVTYYEMLAESQSPQTGQVYFNAGYRINDELNWKVPSLNPLKRVKFISIQEFSVPELEEE